jgi:hypothetical protein
VNSGEESLGRGFDVRGRWRRFGQEFPLLSSATLADESVFGKAVEVNLRRRVLDDLQRASHHPVLLDGRPLGQPDGEQDGLVIALAVVDDPAIVAVF